VTGEVASQSEADCVVTLDLRWTPDPADPAFQGEADVTYTANDGAQEGTLTPTWTGDVLDVSLDVPYANGVITLAATLQSVGGAPVDPAGATIQTAGGHISCP
jgi:hypothetical protein